MVPGCAKWAQGQTEMCRSHTAAKSMCSSVETTRTAGKAWLAFTETKLVAKCDVDESGTIMAISPSFTEAFGYSAVEVVGTKEWELVHPKDMERMLQIVAYKTGSPCSDQQVDEGGATLARTVAVLCKTSRGGRLGQPAFEYRRKHKNGTYVPVRYKSGESKDGKKQYEPTGQPPVVHMQEIILDVTIKMRAAASLGAMGAKGKGSSSSSSSSSKGTGKRAGGNKGSSRDRPSSLSSASSSGVPSGSAAHASAGLADASRKRKAAPEDSRGGGRGGQPGGRPRGWG